MGYNGNLTASCWKIHTCVNCATILRYQLTRKVTATGNTEEQTRVNLDKAAATALQDGVDSHPCPTCGLIQPEMVGSKRASNLGCLMWAAALLLVAMCIAVAAQCSIQSTVFLGFVAALMVAGGQYLQVANNPNRSIEANLATARQEVQSKALFAEPDKERGPSKSFHELAAMTDGNLPGAFALLLVGLLVIALPEGARIVGGWPVNSNWFPGVIGPNDKSTYYFHSGLSSIKGYWKGQVTAVVTNPSEVGKLTAHTQDNNWGSSISAKSSEKNQSVSLWTTVTFPNDSSLAGKDLATKIDVNYVCPVMSGAKNFRETPGSVTETPVVHMAPTGRGALYLNLAWLSAALGPCFLFAAGWWMKSRADGLQGNPRLAVTLDTQFKDPSEEE